MTQDYGWHREKARELWVDKFYNEHNPEHDKWSQLRSMFMSNDELADADDELRYALQCFDDDMESVKFVFNHKHGTCLKVKWECGAWWEGDKIHFYYCVLLPMRGLSMLEPAELQRKKPKQRKLMWWND